MSKSFKKVVACLLAVLMVMFSVPFTALADGPDTTVYTPDIQLQFGTLFNAVENTETWVDNFNSEDPIETAGRGAQPDLTASALCGPILKATTSLDQANAKLTVNGLTIEAADTANYANDDLDALTADYNLKKGDAFTVTVRMDGVSNVYVATAEIGYSGNIEPLYFTESGSGNKYKSSMGTAAQGLDPDDNVWGKGAFPDVDPQALYSGINADEIGSELRTDYNGENYMYAEVLAPEEADWSKVTGDVDLANEDGTFGNKYQNKSIMATFTFVLKEDLNAANPIYFWVHNGNKDAHGIAEDGGATFTGFSEGNYTPAAANSDSAYATTYVTNKFESIDNQFDGEENFGSKKMTFMGVNENTDTPVHEHQWSEWAVTTPEVPATCTVNGTTAIETRSCACGETETRGGEVIEAPGHSYDAVVTAPTCTEGGYTTYTCSVCQDSYTADFTDPNGHAWGEWEVTTPAVAATCVAAGTTAIERRDCANCDEYETRGGEEIPATGVHSYSVAAVVDPTCTEGGYTEYVCIYCKDSYNADFTDPNGHAWGEWEVTTPAVAATCVAAGTTAIERRDCANCDEYETRGGEVVEATGHTPVVIEAVAATCTEAGSTAGQKCSTCQTILVAPQEIPAAGHQWSQWETTIEPTETSQGQKQRTCSVCKEVETDIIPALDHTHNYTPVVTEPTCTEGGYTTYTCTCGDSYTADFTDPNGHAWGEWEVTTPAVAATCVAAGTTAIERRDCANCDEYETRGGEVVEATGHTPVVIEAVAATCTEAGSTEGSKCSVCQAILVAPQEIPANGHAWGEWRVTTPATASTVGEERRDCDNCDAYETREIAPLGVIVTVPKYDLGEVTLNGEAQDGTKVNETTVAFGTTYTLAVTDGADYFKGWEMNGKIVSEETTFESTAYADITVTPVFEAPKDDMMTVIFYDKFGNKIKEYKDYTVQDYQNAIVSEGVPTAPSYPSSKFVSWDMDTNAILGLNTSVTIWAVYEDVESEQKYTVKVLDENDNDITADALTLPAGVQATAVPYDTKATVSFDGAKGWEIDGVAVSTEDTYSFFVGADVTVKMIVADVQAEPTTTVIGANRLADPAYRFNIMATRNVPEGYELVDYGFVYGKNLTDADLAIENEGKAGTGTNSGNVKVARAATKNTSSNEFALNYGIKAMDGTVTVKSFVVAKKGTEVKVVYSAMAEFNY